MPSLYRVNRHIDVVVYSGDNLHYAKLLAWLDQQELCCLDILTTLPSEVIVVELCYSVPLINCLES